MTYFTACNYHSWIPEQTRLMVGYGSHTVVSQMTSPFRLMAPIATEIQWVMEHLGIYAFLPSDWLIQWFASEICDEGMDSQVDLYHCI